MSTPHASDIPPPHAASAPGLRMVQPKNVGTAVLLALLLGPLGLFYVAPAGAIFMTIVTFTAGLFTVGIALVPAWIVCILWAYVAASHEQAEGPRPERVHEAFAPPRPGGRQ